jgi:hypothetical protein
LLFWDYRSLGFRPAAFLLLHRRIRRSIASDSSLSTYAHNIKVIVRDGMVTLRTKCKTSWSLNRKIRGENMPKNAHNEAAQHHENAAKSHRTAAEHHGKGEHEAGKKQSAIAQEQSGKANEASKSAHGKSQQQK